MKHHNKNRLQQGGQNSFESEEDLVEAIKNDNLSALKILVEQYYRRLVNFARHYVDSSSAAKDVVQDVFANLWERRVQWELILSLKLYLYQSVKNEAWKMLRKEKTEEKYIRAFT
ncbi:MAG: sigma factor [Balneolaceae bacterium]|nr:sigma factor [Balneolaceae bacterium]